MVRGGCLVLFTSERKKVRECLENVMMNDVYVVMSSQRSMCGCEEKMEGEHGCRAC